MFALVEKIDATAETPERVKITVQGVTQEFAWIPPGTFMMGSPPEEYGRFDDEHYHEVTIEEGYWMATTPVTQEFYEAVMGSNPSHFKGEAKLPVESVSWYDSVAFCEALGALLGDGLTPDLPTEEEWEYACRAGTTTPFWTGETITTDQANFDGNYPYRPGDPKGVYRGKTTPVDMFPPNPWGLHDMHGNVWEWTKSVYTP